MYEEYTWFSLPIVSVFLFADESNMEQVRVAIFCEAFPHNLELFRDE